MTKKEISDEDFEFIGDLWEKFNLQNLGELHDLYMETDVLLLADVMEGFRTWSLAQYGLDPAHFNTSPGLSWTACLRLTKQKLEIPTDPKMHLFFDRGLTGGASHTATPFAKANIEKFGHYDKKLLKAYIMVFDCNNQYGGAMMGYLPTGGFEWITLDTTSPEY